MIDGQQQRRALTAVEQALHALESADAGRAVEAAHRAAELDQVGLFAALPAAVESAATEIAMRGMVSAGKWSAIAQVLGPGPLAAYAEERAAL
jgi:hypothetical protein